MGSEQMAVDSRQREGQFRKTSNPRNLTFYEILISRNSAKFHEIRNLKFRWHPNSGGGGGSRRRVSLCTDIFFFEFYF